MREDFHRVLTTDPRRGSRLRFTEVRRSKNNATFDEEFSGGKESMKTQRRRTFQQRKSFGDHIQPLRRFMQKQVGRLWSDVYAELCELFDKRSQQLYHVHEHVLRDFIELKTRMGEDGVVQEKSRWGGWEDITPTDNIRRQNIYVHPVTGIICTNYVENEVSRKKSRAQRSRELLNEVFRKHSNTEHLYLEGGVWKLYIIGRIPPLVMKIVNPYMAHRQQKLWQEWNALSWSEKEATGLRRWERPTYVHVDAPSIGGWHDRVPSQLKNGECYISCSVAPRRILKAHGLVGMNEDINNKTMNHRKAATYR